MKKRWVVLLSALGTLALLAGLQAILVGGAGLRRAWNATGSSGSPHHLLSTSEAGGLLGMTRQRVDKLARRDPTFPEPEVTIGRGTRGWSREAMRKLGPGCWV